MLESIEDQQYKNIEVFLIFNSVTELVGLSERFSFIKMIYLSSNGLTETIKFVNKCINESDSDYIIFIQTLGQLSPNALYIISEVLSKENQWDIFYTDEDDVSPDGEYCNPKFKPDWSPDLILSYFYVGNITGYSKNIIDKVGVVEAESGNAWLYDYFLRAMTVAQNILHIPKVLFHNKLDNHDKQEQINSLVLCLNKYLRKNDISGNVELGIEDITFRIRYHINDDDLVSIIVFFKDKVKYLKKLLIDIAEKTKYPRYEVILVSNSSKKKRTFSYLQHVDKQFKFVRFFEYNIPFNYSQLVNHSVSVFANGDLILLLNNDIRIINSEWLCALIEHAKRPEVGAVGAKLLFPDNSVQHAGVVIGVRGVAGHIYRGLKDQHIQKRICGVDVVRNVSAVTGACMMFRRDVFDMVNGFDVKLPVNFNDIDFCLKLNKIGYTVIYTPYAQLYHLESKSRGKNFNVNESERFAKEVEFMKLKWHTDTYVDPYYNVNLTLDNDYCTLRKIDYSYLQNDK
jgi:GT2 family glycosyltransferase